MILGFSEKFPWGEPSYFPEKILSGVKKSTIRKGLRWKLGDKIHFATGVRSEKYKQFATGKATNIHEINIDSITKMILLRNVESRKVTAIYSNTDLMNLFVSNEGFENEDQFWKWFNEDLVGQYIVWELDR